MKSEAVLLTSLGAIGWGQVYKITLAPGDIRYMPARKFLYADVDEIVSEIESVSNEPTVESPFSEWYHHTSGAKFARFDFRELDELLKGLAWDDRLRIHHALGGILLSEGMSSGVYCAFHRHLGLGVHFAVAECLEAWIKETADDTDLANSFKASPHHLVIEYGLLRYAVFAKTDFVSARLAALVEEDRRRLEERARNVERARASDEDQRLAVLAEQLCRSRFTTFVYLMEDSRTHTFKIGRSRTPGKRERTLQSEVPETSLRLSIPADETHEKTLHSRFRHRHIRGEWFNLTSEDLLEIITFLKANGDVERASVDLQWLGAVFLGTNVARMPKGD